MWDKEYKNLLVEVKDRILVVTLNNPPLHLLTIEMMVELKDVFERAAGDKELRCVVLTSAGKHFCAGADVTTFGVLPKGVNTSFGHLVFNKIEECPLPVIAAINGTTLGGGMELTLACDIRIAADTAKIGLVEASLGIIAAYGGQTRLPWLIGETNAKRLFYTAERITAEEAKGYGILQEVVPADQLMERAMAMATKIAGNAPLSLAMGKKIMHDFRASLFGAGFLHEQTGSTYVSSTEDSKEGWRAFKEKRKPNWQNK